MQVVQVLKVDCHLFYGQENVARVLGNWRLRNLLALICGAKAVKDPVLVR
jgi:hypothetical protein